jgi:RimJ/RimL family protein N-acetyltransferase
MILESNSRESCQPAKVPDRVILEGRSTTLEPLSASKHTADLWKAIEGHDSVWNWLADGPYANEAAIRNAIHAKEEGQAARFFAIVPKHTGQAAGYASLMRIDAPNGVIEVGNVMFSPSLQRTAAATEAMYLMAKYVFNELGYRRYEWKCNALNHPSRRAAARLGFTFEGIFRQHMIVKGKSRDTAWFSMLDSEWPGCKQAFESWLATGNFDEQGNQKQSLESFR